MKSCSEFYCCARQLSSEIVKSNSCTSIASLLKPTNFQQWRKKFISLWRIILIIITLARVENNKRNNLRYLFGFARLSVKRLFTSRVLFIFHHFLQPHTRGLICITGHCRLSNENPKKNVHKQN